MQPYGRVAFHTLGCKLNFSETSSIAGQFREAGYSRVDLHETPDIFVLNTCSVTDHADKKCRQMVKRFRKINPEGRILVIGCYAQLKPQEIAEIDGVDLVLGANEKFDLLSYLERLEKGGLEERTQVSPIKRAKSFHPSYSYGDRTRSFLKVQDGCDYFCSFCTIPLARGRSRSGTVTETVERAREIAATEVQEVVLTGVNIGDFGKGGNENFYDLIRALDRVEGIQRFRISSIEPELLSDRIIDFVGQSERFVPHFHMPLQSGSDRILERMRRKYDTQVYRQRVERIRERMPQACIGVDVIVGTPGEDEEEFLKTYRFLQELPVDHFHVFTYSERGGTRAAKMDEKVPIETRKERSKMLRVLSEKKRRAFYESQVGSEREVLFEAAEHEGHLHGYTENYIKVAVPYQDERVNKLEKVRLKGIGKDGTMCIEERSAPLELSY
ncbi:MAG: tRNA (N(6)-L-threonylcarbamoyladenosine(37)-C(2))-methylthiotransferase MtaB [Flavobacteriales bacterium]